MTIPEARRSPPRDQAKSGPAGFGPAWLAARVRGVSTRWRAALSFTGGALGALAMPPFGLWPVLFVSFPLVVWLVDGAAERAGGPWRRARAAAALGWWFGFGFFLAGLWWLGSAFLVDADEFLWALPLGVVGLPAGLALFPAFGFGLAGWFWRSGWRRVPLFAAALALSEWLRATVLTGFPWNAWGMAFGQGDVLAQAAALGGLHWLTALVLFIHTAPATLADAGSKAARFAMPAAGAAVLALVAAFGWWRIPAGPVPVHADIRLRIMQPNIAEAERADPAFRAGAIARYAAISGQEGAGGERLADVTHLIWPESAFPFLIDYTPEALDDITRMLPDGTVLITGAARADMPLPGEQSYRYFNSIRVFDSDGRSLATYDKVHLVPFGEYLPFDDLLRRVGIRQFVHTPGGFEAGNGRAALNVPGLPPASPLICYEAIFPEEATLPAPGRAGFLLNVTNDAWFGMTPGPYQHFAQARLRAIEQGLPMVRAANTGISAVIDPYGRATAQLPLGVAGIIDAELPQPLDITIYTVFYAIWGAGLYWGVIICFCIAGFSPGKGR
ncbi:apolipoprotein N-acyltransferase [Pseudochelatococcus lubricantis]|uniref:Apolipoprotein N-acyltransferase n=1 Tax=Pseudochelatococcus lubricantis TaxID=1538102 RepID=A0ABX0V1Q4_9HYPH|nr:apolipoprotein N-acyltransferase [Pseudochelatococcus lubricantis]NIJ57006.1 apolipoprotein N-acyltransferase [Pseudochelatococcus lubricantis]